MRPNQQVTFLTDGGEDVRDLPLYLNPQAEHLLDWFHVTMRITLMGQLAKGVRSHNPKLAAELAEELERLKWYLWHGKHSVCQPHSLLGPRCCSRWPMATRTSRRPGWLGDVRVTR